MDIHCQERAMERYGIYLDKEDIQQISYDIYNGDENVEFLGFLNKNNGDKVSAWKVKWKDNYIYPLIIFDQKRIVTFYTKNMVKQTLKKKGKYYVN